MDFNFSSNKPGLGCGNDFRDIICGVEGKFYIIGNLNKFALPRPSPS